MTDGTEKLPRAIVLSCQLSLATDCLPEKGTHFSGLLELSGKMQHPHQGRQHETTGKNRWSELQQIPE
jgi:hypothetical protein